MTLRRGELATAARTLVDVLEDTATRYADEPALDDGSVSLSYRELLVQTTKFAGRLTAAGIGPGDKVGIRISSGHNDLYIAILGTLQAGAAYVPVDADDPDERAELVFGEADVAATVGDELALTLTRPQPEPMDADAANGAFDYPYSARMDASSATEPKGTGPEPTDDAWIIFTSGSTGVPKGVAVTHRSAAAFVDAEARLFLQSEPIGPDDRVLAGLSVAFDASCEEMWLAWRHGACLVPAPRSLVRTGMDLGPWLAPKASRWSRPCRRWPRSGRPTRWTRSGC